MTELERWIADDPKKHLLIVHGEVLFFETEEAREAWAKKWKEAQ